MSVLSLFRVQVGQVGVLPGDIRMSSTDDLVTITAPGYLNEAELAFAVKINATDIITAVYGNPLVNKQTFTPIIGANGIITLQTIGGGGSINGAVNLGLGEGLLGVSGADITGKSIVAGANIAVTSDAQTVTIAATGSGGGTITGITDIGVGEGHLSGGVLGADVQVKSLKAGTDIVITEDSGTVTIASTAVGGDITNAANLGTGEGLFATKTGSILNFKSIKAGSNITLTPSGTELLIASTGGGGGGFSYDNVFWVAQNGNDLNDGRSIDSPKLTFASVQASIVSGQNTAIIVLDGGTYDVDNFLFGKLGDFYIYAPLANFTYNGSPAGAMFYVSTGGGPRLTAQLGNIDGTNALYVIRTVSGAGASINVEFQKLSNVTRIFFDETFSGIGIDTAVIKYLSIESSPSASFQFKSATKAQIIGNDLGNPIIVSQATSGLGACLVAGNRFGGQLTGSGDFDLNISTIDFSSFSTSTTGVVDGLSAGVSIFGGFNANQMFNDLHLNNKSILNETYYNTFTSPVSGFWSFVPGYQNGNGQITVLDSNGGVTLPPGSSVPLGWRMTLIQVDRSSGVSIQPQGLDTLCGQPSSDSTMYSGRGKLELIRGPSNGAGGFTWVVSGDVFGSNSLLQTNIYFSDVNGDNATADGSVAQPFKDPTAALAYVIATYTANPAFGINLACLDDAVYSDKLDFTGTTNINIISPTASFSRTGIGVGDDSITTDSPQQLIVLAQLVCLGGGFALNNTGTGDILCKIDVVAGGADNASTGQIILQSLSIGGNLPNSGGGRVRYNTMYRNSGTDGPDAIGIRVDGVSGDWEVLGQITADGKLYDTTTGGPGAGFVMTYDGLSTISLQAPVTPPASPYFQSTPVGFIGAAITLTGSFLSQRVISNLNAGPCTWTMDTGANLTAAFPGIAAGDTITVYVYNNTSATITILGAVNAAVFGATPTTDKSFVITARYGGGVQWDIYV